jgi:hypothetical protein
VSSQAEGTGGGLDQGRGRREEEKGKKDFDFTTFFTGFTLSTNDSMGNVKWNQDVSDSKHINKRSGNSVLSIRPEDLDRSQPRSYDQKKCVLK